MITHITRHLAMVPKTANQQRDPADITKGAEFEAPREVAPPIMEHGGTVHALTQNLGRATGI